jgi:arginase family enzyme
MWNLCKALGLANGANLSIDDLVYVAVRDIEEAEDHLMETHHILNMTTDQVRTLGADVLAKQCLEKLNGVALIYVTFDLDSMDSSICMEGLLPLMVFFSKKRGCLTKPWSKIHGFVVGKSAKLIPCSIP